MPPSKPNDSIKSSAADCPSTTGIYDDNRIIFMYNTCMYVYIFVYMNIGIGSDSVLYSNIHTNDFG